MGLPMMPRPMNPMRDKLVLLASQFTAPSIMKEQRARLHPDPRSAGPQPQEHFARHPPQPAHRGHRRVRVGQILARLRHHLRRRPAALCGVALGLRAPVSGADGEAGCRRDRRHRSADRDQAEEHDAQPALDRRHLHRVVRFPAPAVGARRPDVLPELRHASDPRHGGPGRATRAAAARGIALVRAVSGAANAADTQAAARSPVRAAARRASTGSSRTARRSSSPRPNRCWTSISRKPLFVLVDRIAIGADMHQRIVDTVEICYREAGEVVFEQRRRSDADACGSAKSSPARPAAWNSRARADPVQLQQSRSARARAARASATPSITTWTCVIPDPSLSLEDGAVDPWTKPQHRLGLRRLSRPSTKARSASMCRSAT